MSKDEENTSISNEIVNLLDTYFLFYWMGFLAILGYLLYYFSYKKIFSRGLLKWMYVIFFIIYIFIFIISTFITTVVLVNPGG